MLRALTYSRIGCVTEVQDDVGESLSLFINLKIRVILIGKLEKSGN